MSLPLCLLPAFNAPESMTPKPPTLIPHATNFLLSTQRDRQSLTSYAGDVSKGPQAAWLPIAIGVATGLYVYPKILPYMLTLLDNILQHWPVSCISTPDPPIARCICPQKLLAFPLLFGCSFPATESYAAEVELGRLFWACLKSPTADTPLLCCLLRAATLPGNPRGGRIPR